MSDTSVHRRPMVEGNVAVTDQPIDQLVQRRVSSSVVAVSQDREVLCPVVVADAVDVVNMLIRGKSPPSRVFSDKDVLLVPSASTLDNLDEPIPVSVLAAGAERHPLPLRPPRLPLASADPGPMFVARRSAPAVVATDEALSDRRTAAALAGTAVTGRHRWGRPCWYAHVSHSPSISR